MPLDKIKKEQVDLTSIDKRYASTGLMIADQANQFDKFIYYDGATYWEYLGTTNSDISDYRAISIAATPYFEMIEDVGMVVKFDYMGGYIYGNSGVETGPAVTFDFTNGIRGVVSKMKHSSGTVPTFPAQAIVVSGYYSINTTNYLTFELIKKTSGSEEVWVAIGQLL